MSIPESGKIETQDFAASLARVSNQRQGASRVLIIVHFYVATLVFGKRLAGVCGIEQRPVLSQHLSTRHRSTCLAAAHPVECVPMTAAMLETLQRFAKEEMRDVDFESWVYDTPELEGFLGEGRYQRLISADYRDGFVLLALRPEVQGWLDELAARG
jgi:hypothetical protein